MSKKKMTAAMLAASTVMAPAMAQMGSVVVYAASQSASNKAIIEQHMTAENADKVTYGELNDCRTNKKITTNTGLSLQIQDASGGGTGYINRQVQVYKISDDDEISSSKKSSTINGEAADNYDLSNATYVTTFHTIGWDDKIWVDAKGNVKEYDAEVGIDTGKPTYIELPVGKYILVYANGDDGGFGESGYYQHIPFEVKSGRMTSIDVECAETIKKPSSSVSTGNVKVVAVEVEGTSEGPTTTVDGSFIQTGNYVEGVVVSPNVDESLAITQEQIDSAKKMLGDSFSTWYGDDDGYAASQISMGTTFGANYVDVRKVSNMTTDAKGEAEADGVILQTIPMTVSQIPEGYALADPDNDENFNFVVEKDGTVTQYIELYKIPEEDDSKNQEPQEVAQSIQVVVKDRTTDKAIAGAEFEVKEKEDADFSYTGTSKSGDADQKAVLAGTYTASLVSVPEGYKINTETCTETLEAATTDGKVTTLYLYVDLADKEECALTVIVKDKDTGEFIEDVTVEVLPDNADKFDLTTNTDGTDSVDGLEPNHFTVSVTDVPDGYELPEAQDDTISNGQNKTFIFEVEKSKGSLDIVVYDKDDPTIKIPNATVEIYDKNRELVDTVVTDENGEASKDKLPIGDYTLKVTDVPQGYSTPDDQTKTVNKNENTHFEFELEKGVGDLLVTVQDKETKEPIPNATVEIIDKEGNVINTVKTDENGQVSEKDLPLGDYTIKVTEVPDGYSKPDDETATVKKNEETSVVIELEKATGDLDVIVRDKDTKDPIPDATVEIIDKDGNVIDTVKTDENGKVEKDKLPPGDYTIKVTEVPDGYNKPDDQTVTIIPDDTKEVIFELEKNTGDLDVIVRDKDTKDPIPNATVEILDKDGKVIDTVKTDENGKVEKDKLPAGDYTIKVTEVPDGYNKPDDQTVTIEAGDKKEVIFELEKAVGNLDVIVRDKDTKKPIPNATVEILDKDGKVVLTTTTDTNGKVSKDKLPAGDYTIKVTEVPNGYVIPDNQTATVKNNETTTTIFELEKGYGNLDVLVRDKDTKDPIANATIEICDKDGNVVLTTTTDSKGKYTKENMAIGSYNVKVTKVPDGYSRPADTPCTVEKGKTTSLIFEVEKGVGNLDVLVRDKDTKEPIPNATVEILDKDGNVVATTKTDANGKVVKNDLTIGEYTIKVTEVPDGYNKPDDQKATVEKSTTTNVIFELEKNTGALDVIVRDKDTKDPIPNATVQIVDEDGNVILTTTTDENGKVSKDKLPVGDYTIKVISVPEGYKAPSDQTITIKNNVKTTVIFELEKNKTTAVQTGDNNNIFAMAGAGMTAIAGMFLSLKKFKIHKNKED
jgi:LPXTG-motif cell wall-anchored protein